MRRLALTLTLAALSSGCHGCRNDHPFVPYRIEEAGSVGPTTDGAAHARADASDAGPQAFTAEPARVAPAHATTWALGAFTLTAPAGATFRQALVGDLDGDGHDDVVALVEAVKPDLREDVYLYRGGADGPGSPVVVPLLSGTDVPTLDAHCKRVEHLARVGRRSVAVEVGQACPKEAAVTRVDRTVALLAWSDTLRARLAFTVADLLEAPALAFEFEGRDLDGDGLDDVTLRVTLEGGGAPFEPAPPVHGVFRWFDRTAGLSREPGEPEASLHAIAAAALQHGARSKDAPAALASAAAGRSFYQAVCAESASRRVAPGAATSPLTCAAEHALEELGLAEVRADVSLGDALRATTALDTAEAPPASHTPARLAEATAWINGLAPVVQATSVRAIGAVPLLGSERASWGALRFEPSGMLLVRTPAGVVRVDPVHGDEAEAPGPAWPTKVTSPDGKRRLEGAVNPCRGGSLEATFATTEGGDAAGLALPVARPIGGRCTGSDREPVSAIPIAWGASGLEVVVAGEPLLVTPDGRKASILQQPLNQQPVTFGAPRSPDGTVLVMPSSQGIIVRAQKTRLYRAKELDHGYGELRDCTVSDDGGRVACVRGGVAFVGIWPPP